MRIFAPTAERCRALLDHLVFGRCYRDESCDSHDVSTLSALESLKSSTPEGKRLVNSALHSGSERASAAVALGGGDGQGLGETRLDDEGLRLVVYLARLVAGVETLRTIRREQLPGSSSGAAPQPMHSQCCCSFKKQEPAVLEVYIAVHAWCAGIKKYCVTSSEFWFT